MSMWPAGEVMELVEMKKKKKLLNPKTRTTMEVTETPNTFLNLNGCFSISTILPPSNCIVS